MMRYGFIILSVILLQGCATPEERAARAQAEVEEMITVYGPACEKLGFARNTDPWRECVLRMSARDASRARATTTTCVGQQGFYNCITY